MIITIIELVRYITHNNLLMTVTKITTILISKIKSKDFKTWLLAYCQKVLFTYMQTTWVDIPAEKRKGIGINKQNMCGVSDKKPEEMQHNLLHNIRVGQLHGSTQSKLEFVMEVGQEDRWPAKLQILSGILKPGKQAQERCKWKVKRKKYPVVHTTCCYEHLKVNLLCHNCILSCLWSLIWLLVTTTYSQHGTVSQNIER